MQTIRMFPPFILVVYEEAVDMPHPSLCYSRFDIGVLIDGSREAIQELGQRLGGVDLIGAENAPASSMPDLEVERRRTSKL